MAFLYALPGAVAEGLIWGLMAMGVYISYKILDIADLTVDGSICTGGCVCAVLLTAGVPVWAAVLAALIAGALTGTVTGLLHTVLGIPSILAGILTQLMLYSVNLLILGGKSLMPIDPRANELLVHMSDNNSAVITMTVFVALTIFLLYEFFYTEVGLTLKSTGDNPDMSRAQGVDVDRNKVVGLAIANGIVAMAGALLAQYKGSANINDGRGAIVIALAAIFIGLSVSLKIKPNFVCSLIGVVCGGIVYYIVYNFVILLGLKTDYLKMLSAIIVALFLGVPYLKGKYFTKQKDLHPSDFAQKANAEGGKGHA
ncbi:MAG: ABC transporter permease [Oscillospiraceae bacterium]|nr:ABC transporter permease [Oscillospiraceae bacterium]